MNYDQKPPSMKPGTGPAILIGCRIVTGTYQTSDGKGFESRKEIQVTIGVGRPKILETVDGEMVAVVEMSEEEANLLIQRLDRAMANARRELNEQGYK
jgi:hypothetical protein